MTPAGVYYGIRAQRRKDFEDKLRRQRHHMATWIKYALWEANQQDFRRARSVFERALQVDPNNANLWLRYIETEMKNKNINAARNLFDRVVCLLPRVDQFWFKYAHFEELLGNYAGARTIFERYVPNLSLVTSNQMDGMEPRRQGVVIVREVRGALWRNRSLSCCL